MQLYATLRNMQLYETMQLNQLYANLRNFMQHATLCNNATYETMQLYVTYATICNYMTDKCENFNFMQLNATICNCIGTTNAY